MSLLWVFTVSYNPFPLRVGRTCNLLRLLQWLRDVTSLITLWYIRPLPASRLALESCCLFLAAVEGASCHKSYSLKGLDAAENYTSSSLAEPSDENPAFGQTTIAALYGPKQKTQLSRACTSDSQKLWENMCVLFKAVKFLGICYAAIYNQYTFYPHFRELCILCIIVACCNNLSVEIYRVKSWSPSLHVLLILLCSLEVTVTSNLVCIILQLAHIHTYVIKKL